MAPHRHDEPNWKDARWVEAAPVKILVPGSGLEAEDLQTSPGIVETQVIPVLAGNVLTVRKPLAKDTVYVYRVKDASSRHHYQHLLNDTFLMPIRRKHDAGRDHIPCPRCFRYRA